MTSTNGLRVLIPSRKSRKGKDDSEATRYARQEANMVTRAEADGHVVIAKVHDTVSSQTMPWERKNLKKWFTDPAKLALWDAVYVETDRLSRGDDPQWHYIEHFCYEHGKKIITTEGVQFPPRDDSDRYQWVGLKRRARTYWEDVRDKHAGTRELIKANGAFTGRPMFGYTVEGVKLHKQLVIDPVWGEIAREAFQRIADGKTGSSVAVWLSEVAPVILYNEEGKETGRRPWRIKRVLDMIRRPGYMTGTTNDGHLFEPLVSKELWTAANNALAGRSFKHGGRKVTHAYSGLLFCPCGAALYHHQGVRDGQPVGRAKYRCARGRRGNVTEARCEFGAHVFEQVNEAVDALMGRCSVPERIVTVTGGDHERQLQLQGLQEAMQSAMKDGDMAEVTQLAAAFQEVSQRPSEPILTTLRETGQTYGDVWREGTLDDRRALLERGDFRLTVREGSVELTWSADASPRSVELHQAAGLELVGAYSDLARLPG